MDNTTVYDNFDWEAFQYNILKDKINKVKEIIPEDVKTIVDIGCGNGLITNILGESYHITGIDRSPEALKYVKTEKILASSDNIPLNDHSCDMVFSSELLEHLPDDILEKTVSECKRLSKKYIFITVPNNENPDKLSIKCPSCGYLYNSPNHLRSFDIKKLSALFPEYKLRTSLTFGKKIRFYNKTIMNIKKRISPATSWIPYYWMEKDKRKTTCPSCENVFHNPYKFNIMALGCDILNVAISPKKHYWLFAIFEQKK